MQMIKKELINNEIRYVIHNRSEKEFIFGCWNALYAITRTIGRKGINIKETFISKDSNYNKFFEWLVNLHGERFTSEIIIDCSNKRKRLELKDKQKLFDDIKSTLAYVLTSKKADDRHIRKK